MDKMSKEGNNKSCFLKVVLLNYAKCYNPSYILDELYRFT